MAINRSLSLGGIGFFFFLTVLAGQAAPINRAVYLSAQGSLLRHGAECRSAVESMAQLGGGTLVVQIFHEAMAWYPSEMAPNPVAWPEEDWDPLSLLQETAKSTEGKPVRFQAEINLLRVRQSLSLTAPPREHVAQKHPDWLIRNEAYQLADEAGWMWLDPALPEVRRYLVQVVEEVASRYPLDGIQLASLEYPGLDWGYGKASLALYHEEYPDQGAPLPADSQWLAWRRERLGLLLQDIHEAVQKIKPQCQIIVQTPVNRQFQEDRLPGLQAWSQWAEAGWLDGVALKNALSLETEKKVFADNLIYLQNHAGPAQVWAWVSGRGNLEADVLAMMQMALRYGAEGLVLDSWQNPSRDGLSGGEGLAFLYRTVFDPNREGPAAVLKLPDPPPFAEIKNPEPQKILHPEPEPILRSRPEPRWTQLDVVSALLGKRLVETETLEGADPVLRPRIFADTRLNPLPAYEPDYVRVSLKNGRDFVGERVGASASNWIFRMQNGSAISFSKSRVLEITPLERQP